MKLGHSVAARMRLNDLASSQEAARKGFALKAKGRAASKSGLGDCAGDASTFVRHPGDDAQWGAAPLFDFHG